MNKHLAGRTALLTGATGGIVHAIARALHRRGVQLTITGRRTDVLEPLAQELGARSFAVDLEQPAEVDRLIAEVGHVDLLALALRKRRDRVAQRRERRASRELVDHVAVGGGDGHLRSDRRGAL